MSFANMELQPVAGVGDNKVALTCSGLSMVNWGIIEPEFVFEFGENRVCSVSSGLAEFLSPRVSRMRKSDAAVASYAFVDDFLCSQVAFEIFSDLVRSVSDGAPISVNDSNFCHVFRFACELENDEIKAFVGSLVDVETLGVERATRILVMRRHLTCELPISVESLRSFVAAHFYDLSEDTILSLDLETLILLLSDPQLQIRDEDSLYDLVEMLVDCDLKFSPLFEFVCLEYLTVDRIKRFISFVGNRLLGEINLKLWEKISKRLVLTPTAFPDDERGTRFAAPPGIDFACTDPKSLNGIIANLSRECGGNVHDHGIVDVTASSTNGAAFAPRNVADLDGDSIYCSNDVLDTWICYDFKQMRVTPTSYSIRSHCHGYPGYFNLKSWVLEVSNDGDVWDVVDSRNDNYELDDENVTCNFQIPEGRCKSKYRFIRIRQTGPNHRTKLTLYYVTMSSFEVFGRLYPQ